MFGVLFWREKDPSKILTHKPTVSLRAPRPESPESPGVKRLKEMVFMKAEMERVGAFERTFGFLGNFTCFLVDGFD